MTILTLSTRDQEKHRAANHLRVFSGSSHEVIYDKKKEEFHRGLGEPARKIAWDYAFDYVKENNVKGTICMLEDDVAGPRYIFDHVFNLFRESKGDLAVCNVAHYSDPKHKDWGMWSRSDGYFPDDMRYRCFCPFTIFSERMIDALFAFRETWGCFLFLEVFFASVALQNQFKVIDLNHDEDFACFFPWFYYRPEINAPVRGICHPVKTASIHRKICFGR